jgi:hypothetical protein
VAGSSTSEGKLWKTLPLASVNVPATLVLDWHSDLFMFARNLFEHLIYSLGVLFPEDFSSPECRTFETEEFRCAVDIARIGGWHSETDYEVFLCHSGEKLTLYGRLVKRKI